MRLARYPRESGRFQQAAQGHLVVHPAVQFARARKFRVGGFQSGPAARRGRTEVPGGLHAGTGFLAKTNFDEFPLGHGVFPPPGQHFPAACGAGELVEHFHQHPLMAFFRTFYYM